MQIRLTVGYSILALLCACGGGGGSGATRPVAFTSFADIKPGQTVMASGMSQTENITQNMSGVVTATSMDSPDSNASSARFVYGTASPLTQTGLDINFPQVSLSWRDGRGAQTVSCGLQTCNAAGGGASAVQVNALGSAAWNYQTFGYWLVDTGLPANIIGAISVGNPTAASNIPTSGTATYNGLSGGLYVDAAGNLSQQTAAMTAAVNFTTRTVNFSTTNSAIRPWGSNVGMTAAPTLDMSAPALTYAAGTNQFSGPVTTAGMTGTAVGRFYGPAAQEIGGTYSLTNGAIQSMIGGFGGKR
jgi:hypothetical protein